MNAEKTRNLDRYMKVVVAFSCGVHSKWKTYSFQVLLSEEICELCDGCSNSSVDDCKSDDFKSTWTKNCDGSVREQIKLVGS